MAKKKEEIKEVKEEIKEIKEVKEVVENVENVVDNSERADKINYLKKKHQLMKFMQEYKFQEDGYNDNQKYVYIKSKQFRTALTQGCLACGLTYTLVLDGLEHSQMQCMAKMFLTTISAKMCLQDIDTGYEEEIKLMATGADNLDKGVYKAETMAIKYFVQNNLGAGGDEIDPESTESSQPTIDKPLSKFTTPEAKKEMVKQLVSEEMSTKEYINHIIAMINTIRGVEPEYGTATLDKLYGIMNGETDMITQTAAVNMMNKLEKKAEGLK